MFTLRTITREQNIFAISSSSDSDPYDSLSLLFLLVRRFLLFLFVSVKEEFDKRALNSLIRVAATYCQVSSDKPLVPVVGKPCCSSVELVSPKPESGFQQDDLIVGSNRPGDLEMISRCRLDR